MKEILISYTENKWFDNRVATLTAANLHISSWGEALCIANDTLCALFMPNTEENKAYLCRILRVIYEFMANPGQTYMTIHLIRDEKAKIQVGTNAIDCVVVEGMER